MRKTPARPNNLVPMAGDNSLGVTLAAGLLLIVLGSGQVLLSIIALNNDDDALTPTKYSFQFSTTTWGWIHLVVGILAIVVGIGLLVGRTWAFIAGLVIASVSALTNFAFLPQAPLWSALLIGFDVLVIWALVSELNEPG